MRVTPVLVLAACGALLVAAPGAAGATLTADQGCYVEGTTVGLTGAGFAPGAAISLEGEQIAPLTGPTGADGAFQVPVEAPLLGTVKPATTTLTVTATDPATSTAATVDVLVATAVFSTSTGFKSPRASRTWKFSGLFQRPGKPIYGHFRHNGRTFANYRFGVPQGPCGTLTRRAPGIPARTVPAGKWKVQVDFSRTYDPKATPRLTGSTTVITTYG